MSKQHILIAIILSALLGLYVRSVPTKQTKYLPELRALK